MTRSELKEKIIAELYSGDNEFYSVLADRIMDLVDLYVFDELERVSKRHN